LKSLLRWSFIGLLISSILVFLGGCGFKDIEKRFFVVSIGVDLAEDGPKKYLISLKLAIPAVNDKPSEFIIVSQEADTITEAVRIIKTKVDKEIDFGHAKVIVFGNDIVNQNMPPNLYYWFTRRRDIQKIAWVTIGKPNALAVLKVKPKFEEHPSNALFLSLGGEGSETAYLMSEFLFDMKKKFKEKGLDPILPIIEAKKDIFIINTVGLFNKKRMKLRLGPEETKLLNYFTKNGRKGAVQVTQDKKTFLIDVQKVKIKYKIYTLKGKTPFIKVTADLTGRIEEANFPVENDRISSYERAAEHIFSKELKKLLVKIQKADVDPIGFGLRYRAHHFNKDDWENWTRIYPEIDFKVQAKVQIEDTGLIE
jgi:spore germination protein KC